MIKANDFGIMKAVTERCIC